VFVGIGRFELFIGASGSLKDKRQVVRSVTQTVAKKFNVSIAEVEFQDLWQRAALGVACVSESAHHCRKVMQEVEKAIERSSLGGAEIVSRSFEVVSLEDLMQ
jgi:uncharacterized protein YlxP (DUF503 family)